MKAVAVPVLLLPFAAWAARRPGGPVCVAWAGVRAVSDGDALDLASQADAVMAASADEVVVSAGGGAPPDIRATRHPRHQIPRRVTRIGRR